MQNAQCKLPKKKEYKKGGGYSAFNLFNYNKFWTWPVSNVGVWKS